MGTKAILARYAPEPVKGDFTDTMVKWSGNAVLTDGSPDRVIPSLIQLRNTTVNKEGRPKFRTAYEMTHFLIDEHPGGWHSLQNISWKKEPGLVYSAYDQEAWAKYLDIKHIQRKRQPLFLSPDGVQRFTNTSPFYGYWAYVIVEDLDTVTVMAKYPDDYHWPRWSTVATYKLFYTTNLLYPRVPNLEKFSQMAKDSLYLHPEDVRFMQEDRQ